MPFVHSYPYGGVGPKLYDSTTNTWIARPTSPVLLRFYRSVEGYNYNNLRIIGGVNPVSLTAAVGPGLGGGLLGTTGPGWWIFSINDPSNPGVVFKNYAAVIIKRVSSTAWLELRWNAVGHARALLQESAAVSPPYAFELWCSHNASGTLATTRLATWDYSGASVPINVPFDVSSQLTFLDIQLLGDVVTWSLMTVPPTGGGAATATESGEYSIPSALSTVVGSGVAGKPGAALFIDNPPGSDATARPYWQYTAMNPPFLTFMYAYDADAANTTTDIPVIGDAEDTPPLIKIKGPVSDPTLTFWLPNDDGSYETVNTLLQGTIAAGDELTIDLANGGTITDSSGANRYNMLGVGSRLPMLRPGVNKVNIQAKNQDETMPENLSVVWRDALK